MVAGVASLGKMLNVDIVEDERVCEEKWSGGL
jgi:hypothetical protein